MGKSPPTGALGNYVAECAPPTTSSYKGLSRYAVCGSNAAPHVDKHYSMGGGGGDSSKFVFFTHYKTAAFIFFRSSMCYRSAISMNMGLTRYLTSSFSS
jgi:hypothetical protein